MQSASGGCGSAVQCWLFREVESAVGIVQRKGIEVERDALWWRGGDKVRRNGGSWSRRRTSCTPTTTPPLSLSSPSPPVIKSEPPLFSIPRRVDDSLVSCPTRLIIQSQPQQRDGVQQCINDSQNRSNFWLKSEKIFCDTC